MGKGSKGACRPSHYRHYVHMSKCSRIRSSKHISPSSACSVVQDSKNPKTFSIIFPETGLESAHRPPLQQPLATDLDALAKRAHSKFTSGPSPRPSPGYQPKADTSPPDHEKNAALKVQPNARSLCLFSSSVSESVRDRAINGRISNRANDTNTTPPPLPPSAAAVAGGSSCGGGRTKPTLRAASNSGNRNPKL